MNRTDALIKGLQILNKYEGNRVATFNGKIYCGPEDYRVVSDEDAKDLDELGWYTNNYDGWAFEL